MAPAEDDISIEEKRVYAGTAGRTDAYVATGNGVVRVALSADKVGAFDMVSREPARDVAALPRGDDPDLLGVAREDGLLVAAVGDDPAFEPAGTDPAVAVGTYDGAFLVATESGGIDRVEGGGDPTRESARTVTRIGDVPNPSAIDGPLIAAADGVHRVIEQDGRGSPDLRLAAVGLDDVRDVAGAGMPLAATGSGLYWLGNGWMTALEGDTAAVAADGDGHAMAVVEGDLLVHGGAVSDPETADRDSADDGWDADAWGKTDLPVDEEAVALGYGPGLSVVVTAAGTLCVDAGDGWRHQVVGVRDVASVALAVVE